ncbi:hypothetical protein CPB84DRAFT_1744364 [Gymnopilus junonius]|uniref:O-methyltransferase C-terminal domain-containing protein n=1 Tax=Gymnopilus junonius TaxID=109634 RepID=A0A9P5NVP6_GYMJU|nr:hypothetical protein CPB84DRAFT_1744364 [Gymnopilus junonius]
MTIAVLRSLHAIIGDAIDDIERVYASHGRFADSTSTRNSKASDQPSLSQNPSFESAETTPRPDPKPSISSLNSQAYASPPPSPSITTTSHFLLSVAPAPHADTPVDFPSLDLPCDPTSLSEMLTTHPTVLDAIGRIVAAAGQLSATVQYHLQSCMRLLEASHVPEILREAGPEGLHVDGISRKNGVQATKLAHILRLLAAHHILREVSPDVFALNRISSLVDSGKMFSELKAYQEDGTPEMKYSDTGGTAAFVGLCTDEIQKSSAYMTETYYLSPSQDTRNGSDPARAPFCFAFDTLKSRTSFFGWLEGETETKDDANYGFRGQANSNKFRLERFGKAMSGSEGWETPGAILNGFDWHTLPHGSVVVDVGGGIGSTSMLLATAFFWVSEDRPVVCEMGEKAWKAKCPELLESGTARFQVHDFFTPQPVRNASVFLLRCVLHDWPNDFAQQILLRLREAATPETKLVIADFLVPLACADDVSTTPGSDGVEGAEIILPPAPLLPNLGKANANVYWMDLTMQVMFNSQERTLREIVDLTSSAGWKIVKVTKTPGSSLGYLIAVPVSVPAEVERANVHMFPPPEFSSPRVDGVEVTSKAENDEPMLDTAIEKEHKYRDDLEVVERASSRCGTPTFGSQTRLSSVQEALARFGGGIGRSKAMGRSFSSPSGNSELQKPSLAPPLALKPALLLVSGKKKRPSPLSVPPLHSSHSPVHSPSPTLKIGSSSPRGAERPYSQLQIPSQSQTQGQSLSSTPKIIPRRKSFANLRSPQPSTTANVPPLPIFSLSTRQPPPSPLSPVYPETHTHAQPRTPIRRRASHAQLNSHTTTAPGGTVPPMPSLIPVPVIAAAESPTRNGGKISGSSSPHIQVKSRSSNALQVPHHVVTRKRSGTVAGNANLCGGERLTWGRGHGRQMSMSSSSEMSSSVASRSPIVGGVSVLAAAARIEKGLLYWEEDSN